MSPAAPIPQSMYKVFIDVLERQGNPFKKNDLKEAAIRLKGLFE